jgi:hypothetical protein
MTLSTSKHAFPLRWEAAGAIDQKSGLIRGVSLCTEGPARGHGVLCDRTTLEQLKSCAEEYAGGLKVKMSHRGEVGDIVGFLTGLRIEARKLRGDLQLLENAPQREYVLELAERIPDTFGLSVAFSGPTEEIGGLRYARCTEIYSCDLVDAPAANSDGLFSSVDANAKGGTGNKTIMTIEEIQAACKAEITTALAEFAGRVGKLEDALKTAAEAAKLSALEAKLAELTTALDTAKTELAAKIGDSQKNLELTAQTVAKEFARHTGRTNVPADLGGSGGNPPADPTPIDRFVAAVEKNFKETKSQSRALSLAIGKDPEGYKAFRDSGKPIKYAA